MSGATVTDATVTGATVTDDPSASGLAAHTKHHLNPDPSRTLCRLFVPGNEALIRGESRAMAVLDRVLGLTEAEAADTLARTLARYSAR